MSAAGSEFRTAEKGNDRKISAELKQNRQPLNVLDPGCGTGTLLVALAGKFPDHNFTGIEWNRITAAIASFRTRKLKNVRILRQDMFDFSFAEFDIIACFLMQPLMERFGAKLKRNAGRERPFIPTAFTFPEKKRRK